jgi:hypothetical protein
MNSFERRVARLEEAERGRITAHDEADDAVLRELYGADVLAGVKAGRIDPVSLLPHELIAYLNGGPTPLPPNLHAGLDLFVAECEAKRRGGRAP